VTFIGRFWVTTEGDTINGYKMDVIRHIFQTSIRQGDEHRALQCMVELDISGSADWMWNRMPKIAAEDIGLARLGLQREIEDLRVQWKRNRNDKMCNSYRLFSTNAVLLLVRVQKSRLRDHALIEYYNNQQPIEISAAELKAAAETTSDSIAITDDDLDMHTAKGRAMGRRKKTAKGINHFWDVAAKLNNQAPINDPYKEKARQTLLQKAEK